jgi:glucose dehydrogenase
MRCSPALNILSYSSPQSLFISSSYPSRIEPEFQSFSASEVVSKAGPGGNRGEFTAWDPVAGKAVWTIKEDLPLWSGTMATAGGLVFYGTMDGWFKAIDA